MRVTRTIILAAALLVGNSVAHAQGTAQSKTSSNTSAQAGRSGAQVSSDSSASSSAAARAGQNSGNLSGGTTMNAALSQSVDAKKNKPGDAVTAKTTEATKSDGKVVIPKGSKLVGHVTEAKPRTDGESQSSLGIVFDKAILKSGQEIPLNVTVRALAAAHAATTSSLADDDFSADRIAGEAAAGRTSGGGALGGVASTAGATSGAVTNTAANVDGVTGSAVGGAVGSAGPVVAATKATPNSLNAAGHLTSNSQGVFGLDGIRLNSAASSSAGGSTITSTSKNVHLDSGTQLLLAASDKGVGK